MKVTGKYEWRYQDRNFRERAWIPQDPKAMIVLIHGIGEHTGRYAEAATFFNAHRLAVTGFDLFGHGESPGQRGGTLGFENTLDQLQCFIDKTMMEYRLPVIVYGHSMGGGLLAALVLRRRPRINAAVLSAPGLRITNTPSAKKIFLRLLSKILPDMQISQGFDVDKLTRDQAERERFQSDPLNHGFVSVRLAHEMISSGEWCIKNAGQLTMPLLTMHGTADDFTDIVGSRALNAHAPSRLASLLEWPGAYHELHHEPEKAKILGAVVSWINAVL